MKNVKQQLYASFGLLVITILIVTFILFKSDVL